MYNYYFLPFDLVAAFLFGAAFPDASALILAFRFLVLAAFSADALFSALVRAMLIIQKNLLEILETLTVFT